MNSIRLVPILATAALCVLPQFVRAQSSELPPLGLLRGPKDAAWTIEFQYPAPNEEAAPRTGPARMKSLTVQKQQDTYHEVATFEDGKKRERWVLNGIQFETTNAGQMVTRLLSSDSSASDYSTTDFPELNWVVGLKPRVVEKDRRQLLLVEIGASERALTKKETDMISQLEQQAKIYSKLTGKGEEATPAPDLASVLRSQANGSWLLYLDPTTKLPVRFESPAGVRTYSYSSTTTPLQPPPHFKGAYQVWKDELTAASRRTSSP